MRKLSNTFLLVGGILAFVYVGLFAIIGTVFVVMGTPVFTNFIQQYVTEHPEVSDLSPEQAAQLFAIIFISCGVTMYIIAAFCVPSGIVALKARQNPTHGMLVANIVFGVLAGTAFNIAGGVLGLIRNNREERNARNNVIDAK